MVQRKPVPTNANLPVSLRVGPPQGLPPQYDGSAESRPQKTSHDDMPPALSPGSVPVYQERNPARVSRDMARRSAEVGRGSAEVNRPAQDMNGGWSNVDGPQSESHNGMRTRQAKTDTNPDPPEFAHLAAASAKNLSPPSQQFSDLYVADSANVSDVSRGNTAQSYPTVSSDSRGNTAQSHIQPQNTGSNPWGDSMPVNGMLHAPPEPTSLHRVTTADSANDSWAFDAINSQPAPPNRAAPTVPGQGQHVSLPVSPQELPAYQQESPGWDEEQAEHAHTPLCTPPSNLSASIHNLSVPAQAPPLPDKGVSGAKTPEVDQGTSSTNPFDEAGVGSKGAIAPQCSLGSNPPAPMLAEQAREEGAREDLDHGLTSTSPTGEQENGVVTGGGDHILDQPNNPPALPPRSQASSIQGREYEGTPPAMPPRPSLDEHPWAQEQTYAPPPGPPPGHAGYANDEKYQIKKITWHDHSSSFNPRVSPILTQNNNGPCPLLALVNAMILSTPSDGTNEVGQYLAHKTEVSLDDLLQAIINEHLSEENCRKRAVAGQEEYPDIGELHEFLKRLHTGMNVNPRFIPPDVARSPDSMRNSMSHVHPSQRSEESIPGGFEQTKELDLYASFGIRLIHGWLPEPSSPAYQAFRNQAQTHEDAQLLLLRQDELESKLSNSTIGGLSEEEAKLLQDISLMHDFLRANPTQLSPFGLEAIRTSLRNGEFAILFRNSHFLVLYKHPETEMLFALVTDEGYRETGEVVWESLGDCDGRSMEIFSGNFEIISGADHASRTGGGSNSTALNLTPSGAARRPELDTIPSDWTGEGEEERRRREREDADMAFAMQVQDEFNEESEAQEARRRREQELSERFIESSRTQESTIPIQRPEGGTAPPARGDRWASRGGAGPIGPAANALRGGRTSMLDPIGGPRVSIPTRRRPSQGTGTPISPVTGNPRVLPSIPIGRPIDGPLRVVNQTDGIPMSLLQQQRPVDPEAGVENPPPNYEEAASQPKYEGPVERPQGGGPAVAGGVIGEAAGVHEDTRNSPQELPGVNNNGNRRQSLGLRETLSAQARRVNEMRRQQAGQQAGVSPTDPRLAQDGTRRRDEDCVVM